MKKLRLICFISVLMISLTACFGKASKEEDIYQRIHSMYYDIASYSAKCNITAISAGGENSFDCDVRYNSTNDSYELKYDDMAIKIAGDKTIITKGANTIETLSTKEDMYIFINSFFKSYYESEDTVLSVSNTKESSLTLLECSVLNPTDYISSMKLWLDSETAAPKKMHILGSDNKVHTKVVFKSFAMEN